MLMRSTAFGKTNFLADRKPIFHALFCKLMALNAKNVNEQFSQMEGRTPHLEIPEARKQN